MVIIIYKVAGFISHDKKEGMMRKKAQPKVDKRHWFVLLTCVIVVALVAILVLYGKGKAVGHAGEVGGAEQLPTARTCPVGKLPITDKSLFLLKNKKEEKYLTTTGAANYYPLRAMEIPGGYQPSIIGTSSFQFLLKDTDITKVARLGLPISLAAAGTQMYIYVNATFSTSRSSPPWTPITFSTRNGNTYL